MVYVLQQIYFQRTKDAFSSLQWGDFKNTSFEL